jgi:hypothetical protein
MLILNTLSANFSRNFSCFFLYEQVQQETCHTGGGKELAQCSIQFSGVGKLSFTLKKEPED